MSAVTPHTVSHSGMPRSPQVLIPLVFCFCLPCVHVHVSAGARVCMCAPTHMEATGQHSSGGSVSH